MKKIILAVLVIAVLAAAGWYFLPRLKPTDETKTTEQETTDTLPAMSEDNSLETIDEELSATDLTDFDREIDALDESIDQL